MITNKTIEDTILSRRTIRKFLPDDIPLHVVVSILEDAKWAPNHKIREPWEIILFKGEGRDTLVERVGDSLSRIGLKNESSNDIILKKRKKFQQFVTDIPIHLLIYMKPGPTQKAWHEDFAATCAFMQNVQLLAWSMGLGTVWKTNEFIFDPQFKVDLGLNKDDVILGMLHLGKPAVIPEPKERTSVKHKLTIYNTHE
ncbi:nitroreductase [Pseudalkalibacillus hwajinpoensis]|uniref:nitroreductase family protein n=1 Tax=Guptibacillus hwajinpoensis TaxID=208199 RepID=UPI00325BC0CA